MPSLLSSINVSTIALSTALVCALSGVAVYAVHKAYRKRREFMKVANVCKLIIYPIKSLPGIEVNRLEVTSTGTRYGPFRDRMITQRTEGCSKLALLSLQFNDNMLWITAPDLPTLKLKVKTEVDDEVIETKVWGDPMEGVYCGLEAEEFFAQYLNKTGTKLIQHIPKQSVRDGYIQVNNAKVIRNAKYPIIYQDNAGLLVINQSSVDDLNSRLPTDALKTSYRNFRPNILISECDAFDEDNWQWVSIRDVEFKHLKPCDRCVFTTINPDTGIKNGVEPLQTLRSYRMATDKLKKTYGTSPLFGAQIGPKNEGEIYCGDDVLAVYK
ncbi:unnamed protein product [Oppiella nova]|uniref:MOSC domain-containing protein n=1 Tax=Oppiella nova TaxID=334625 RepID=A0A7R9LTG8_9ACAR|nr:unnamed protein product [Oppiella nova]CAG2166741.1 unnamed protein product [Oppiella nova]